MACCQIFLLTRRTNRLGWLAVPRLSRAYDWRLCLCLCLGDEEYNRISFLFLSSLRLLRGEGVRSLVLSFAESYSTHHVSSSTFRISCVLIRLEAFRCSKSYLFQATRKGQKLRLSSSVAVRSFDLWTSQGAKIPSLQESTSNRQTK